MNELLIELTEISPQEFFGQQNANIELLKKYFPKLKIVARGNKIKVFGDEELLEEFDKRFDELTNQFAKYNKLDENMIERILTSTSKADYTSSSSSGDVLVHGVSGRLSKAQTANQRRMVDATKVNDMVFAIGPAGTGKTYTGVALAVKALKEKQVRRIILTRPAVEAGENLGFLPGDLKEKLDPYMQPLYDALRDMIPSEKLEKYIEDGTIQIAPMAFMRGRTLDNAFVILDEAQNTTHGDPGQIDLPRRVISGLKEALLILKNVDGISIIYLDDKDVIRHKLVKKVIDAYQNIEHQNQF